MKLIRRKYSMLLRTMRMRLKIKWKYSKRKLITSKKIQLMHNSESCTNLSTLTTSFQRPSVQNPQLRLLLKKLQELLLMRLLLESLPEILVMPDLCKRSLKVLRLPPREHQRSQNCCHLPEPLMI